MYRAPSPRVPSPSPGYAPSPSYVRGASPAPGAMRSVSPIPMAMSPSMQPLPMGASPAQVAPGTITYTSSYAPNGTLQYHTFKAVPVSYQIPDAHGVLRVQEGMQWIPAEATSVLPQNAMPASADFASAWKKGTFKENDHSLREWQRDEEKRRRKEEREATKRMERARREREKEEKEMRRAHENEMRRRSGNYGASPAGYAPASPYSPYANPVADLEHQFKSTGISGNRRSVYADPARPPSPYHPPGAPIAPPSPVSTAANPGYGPAAGFYPPASPYRGGGGLPGGYPADQPSLSRSRAPSPAPGPYGSRSRAPSPVPVAGIYGAPRSRVPSPVPGAVSYGQQGYPPAPAAAAASYQQDQQQRLAPPDGFARPPNLAQSYTYFETMKIQDMEDFYDNLPPMPLVLVPHDVYHADWIRFMEDVALAWAGKLPANGASRRSQMAAELVEVWNNAFFQQRGVEAVLYKGRERRSGPLTGTVDRHLPGFDSDSELDSDSSLTDDSDQLDDRYRSGAYGGHYGRPDDREAKRRQREKKEKKRKQKEKAKRRAEKTYALYLTCIPAREGY